MNMISTGAFLPEMDASNKQSTIAEKFVALWEKKNAKVARAGGLSLMALSLAACGSDDTTTTTTDTTTTTTTTPTVDAAKDFLLTTAANTGASFTGGSGDDSFTGTDTTLTIADGIDGGSGTDTLTYTDTSAAGVAPTLTQVAGMERIVINNQSGTADVAAIAEQQELVLTGAATTGTNTAFLGVNTAVLTADAASAVATKIVANKANVLAGATATAAGITDISASGAVLTLTYGGPGGKGDVANLSAASASNGTTANASNETVKGALAVTGESGAMTVDMTSQTGSTEVVNSASTKAVTFNAIQNLATDVSVSGVTAGANATTTANFKASLITGAADSVDLNLTSNTSSGTVTIGAGFETVNVAVSGTNTLAALTTGATTVNITGSGNLTVTATVAAATKIDGSAATGKLAIESAVNTVDIKTGSGADTVTVGIADTAGRTLSVDMGAGDDKISITNMDTADRLLDNKVTIAGGDGTDTFSGEQELVSELGALSAANYAKKGISGFEKVEIDDATANGGSYNVANFGVNHVIATTDTTNDATLTGLTSGATVELGKAVVDFGGTNGTDDVAITLTDRAGTGDVVNLVTKNTTGAGNFDLALAEVETINITATGSDQANTFDLNAASLTDLTVATKTGDVTVDISATGNAATALETVDASGSTSTGGLIFTASGSAVKAITFTGGTGGDTFDGTTLSDAVTAGSGNDNIDVKGGTADTINISSGGSDTIDITVLTGSMTVTGFTTGDILDFSAGTVDDAEVAYTAALAGAQNITDATTVVVTLNATTSSALTAGSQKVADFTDMTDVAAYLEEFMNVANSEAFAVVLNDGTNSYAYHVSGNIGTIDAAEVSLLATVENHVVVLADILTT